MATRVEFGLLGPMLVCRDGIPVRVPAGRQRALLAALLLSGGQVVPADDLIEVLWAAGPPPSARATLYNYVKRLRAVLGDTGHDRILTQPRGYAICVDPGDLDVARFEALLAHARAAMRADLWGEVADRARGALALWRGNPLADVQSEALEQREVPRLAELRLQALEVRLDAELRLGGGAETIPELRGLAAAHPWREQLHALLMTALYQAGRQAEALAAYRHARRILLDDLGTEPGTGLKELHHRILTADPGLAAAAAAGPAAAAPRALPGTVPHFSGRNDELAALTALSERAGQQAPGTAVISAIGGTAGVGKTALAIHWAHQVAGRFPDGQLYVNLRGYDPDAPMGPDDALAVFLRALGVPGHQIPAEPDERSARYRGLLAGRRILVLLDNARSAEQVRPLLPATDGCMVLVTSRDSLAGLVARDGALRVDLDLLPAADAVALLQTLIGHRAVADPDATRVLAEHCSRLPLALRVAAERASARPDSSVASLVAELADEHRRLDLLDAGGDPQTAVRAVFSWSYRHLTRDVARAFRLLGLLPGPDADRHVTAALVGGTAAAADQVLGVLARAHLIQLTRPGHYGLHDLLRTYARELASRDEPDQGDLAVGRVLDYYVVTAAAAMDLLFPAERGYRPLVAAPAGALPPLVSPGIARTWLDTELPGLVAAVVYAAEHGWSTHAIQLAATLFRYLDGGRFAEAVTVHGQARLAAQRLGDPAAEAQALRNLAVVDTHQCRYEQASRHIEQSLPLFRQAGDLAGEAGALSNLGAIDFQQGRYRQAQDRLRRSLAAHRALGDPPGAARALSNLGLIHLRHGRLEQAVIHFDQARILMARAGHRYGEAHTLANLGEAELRLGRHEQATDYLEQSRAMFRDIGDVSGEAYVITALGEAEFRQGRREPAIGYHEQSLALFRETGDPAGLAKALNSLGETFLAASRPADAHTRHTEALDLARQIDDQYEQARAHYGLGQASQASGDAGQARRQWRLALALYTHLGTPEADHLRTRLA